MTALAWPEAAYRPLLGGRLAGPLLVGSAGAALVFVAVLVTHGGITVAVAAAGAVGILPLAVSDPFVSLLIFAGLEVSQVSAPVEALGVPSPLVLSQLIAVLSLSIALLRRRIVMAWSPVLLGALLLFASRALSVATSIDPSTSIKDIASMAKDLLSLVLTMALLLTTRRLIGLLRICVSSLAVLSLLTAVQEFVLGNSSNLLGFAVLGPPDIGSSTYRHSGPVGDPNFWGRVLVIFVAFGAALALSRNRRRARVFWWIGTASIALGIFLSQSRGAYLAFGVAAVTFLVLAGWRYARWLALTPVVLGVLLLLPATGPRLQTLLQVSQSSSGGGDASLVLRLESQQAGAEMVRQHPLLGVGAGNYQLEESRLTRTLGFATTDDVSGVIAPHNAYLEYAAEGGYVGLAGLLAFVSTIIFCAGRAWVAATKGSSPLGGGSERLLAAACLAGTAGWVAASAVLHVRQFRTLLVLAAVAAVLDIRRRRAFASALQVRQPARELVPVAAVVLLGLLGGLAVKAASELAPARWRVTDTVVVSAKPAPYSTDDAYAFDLLTRGQLVPTAAAISTTPTVVTQSLKLAGLDPMTWHDYSLTAVTKPRSAVITLVLEGDDRAATTALGRRLPSTAAGAFEQQGSVFRLDTGTPPTAPLRLSTAGSPLELPALLIWLVLFFGVAWRSLARRHRRRLRAYAARGFL